jgi:hypothetical protein
MRRLKRAGALFVVLSAMIAGAVPSHAADAGPKALPPGHPPVTGPAETQDEDEASPTEIPPGHPATTGQGAPAVPQDTATVDPSLPAGSLVVEVRDADDRPVPRAEVSVASLVQTVAKSDSRRRTTAGADEAGNARFTQLPTGATASFRVTVPWSGPRGATAVYAAPPFQLDLTKGERVRVHVYPVSSEIDSTLIAVQAMAYLELKDDAFDVSEIYQIYNLGKATWIPNDVVIDLPSGAKVLASEAGMDDARFEAVSGGAKLLGTFSPGQHDAELRLSIPYDPGATFETTLGLPPHVARMRVVAEAGKDMKLSVDGFASASPDRNQRGQRVLIADRQLRNGERPLGQVHITLDNLPGPGSARYMALAISAAAVAVGLYFGLGRKTESGKAATREEAAEARLQLVAALATLERARDAGEVGPKTFARDRQLLLDALARLLPEPAR